MDHQIGSLSRHEQQFVKELYVFVSRALLGSQVEASIDLTGQGLQAKVQVGGQAMESMKTLATSPRCSRAGKDAPECPPF